MFLASHTTAFGWLPTPAFYAEAPRSLPVSVGRRGLRLRGPVCLSHAPPLSISCSTRAALRRSSSVGMLAVVGPGVSSHRCWFNHVARIRDVLPPIPLPLIGIGMSPDNRDDCGDVRPAAGLHPCRMGSLLAPRLARVFGPKRIEIGVSGQPPRGPWSRKGFDLRALWCWLWIWLYGLWWWYWPPRARCRCVRMVIGMCVRICVRIPSALRSGLCGLAFRHRLVDFGLRSRVGPACLRLDPELGKH